MLELGINCNAMDDANTQDEIRRRLDVDGEVFIYPGRVTTVPEGYAVEMIPPKRMIGLVGYAQTGKDEAAKALAEFGWRRVSFADGVREALYALNPEVECRLFDFLTVWKIRDMVDSVGWEEVKHIPKVREYLQRMGTEAGRDIHGQDCWVNRAMQRAADLPQVVFTDVRFPNEAAAIVARGGIMVSVERPGVGPVNGHVSDTGVADIECQETWVNDGDLNTWRKKVQENLKNLVEKSPSQPDSVISA
jgi:hypothetical protein